MTTTIPPPSIDPGVDKSTGRTIAGKETEQLGAGKGAGNRDFCQSERSPKKQMKPGSRNDTSDFPCHRIRYYYIYLNLNEFFQSDRDYAELSGMRPS